MLLALVASILLLIAGCGESTRTEGQSENSETNNEPANDSSNDSSYVNQDYSFSSGQPEGVMYPTAVAISNILKEHTEWNGNMNIFPGGALSNVMNIQQGKAQFGISYTSAVVLAKEGGEVFGEPHDKIANGASLFPFYAHWVTLENSGIDSIEDLKGKKINVGVKGQASHLIANDILEVYGMSEDDLESVSFLNYGDAFQQLRDGQLDALFLQQDAPYSGFQELALTLGIKLLPIDEDKLILLQQKNSGYIPSVINAGTYNGIDYDVPTIETPISFVVSKELPEQLIYDLIKALDENFEQFQQALPPMKQVESPEEMARDIGLEFHPGAEKYYKEKGWID